MHLQIDEYAHLDSPLHRWSPRAKFITLFVLIVAFSLVQNLVFVPLMLLITLALFAVSRLPLHFLLSRLRYPGIFLLSLIVILPLFTGETILWQAGPLAIRAEGLTYMLLVVSRFLAILTVSLVAFATTPFLQTIRTLRSIGLPPLMADMLLLTVRYLFEIADALVRMQRAMRLRGFRFTRLDRHSAGRLASLLGSLLIRSYEQADRVYRAMRLRGYAANTREGITMIDTHTYTAGQPALTIQNLSFAYPERPPALTAIDLTIAHGERVGIVGPNGAGKSSLFLSICGILKASGTVEAYGQPVISGKYHPAIGLVFQHSDDQLFSPSVQEDIAFGPVNLGFDPTTVEARVSEAAKLTGITHLLERAPHHLSGGEKRMVSIAGVLAMNPGLVLYDEPDANLDMRARRRLIQFLQDAPHTVMIASHDLEMVLEVCDRLLLIDGGQIIVDGDPRQIMADEPLMLAHGLERPHSLVPHRHMDGTKHTYQLDDDVERR